MACLKIKKCTKYVFKKSFYIMERKKGAVMAKRYEISGYEWKQIKELFPKENTGKPRKPLKDNRTMLNAMVWLARNGAA